MKESLVLTLIGTDQPGIVEQLAGVLAEHGANWQDSSMARLGGHFAGILIATTAPEAREALLQDLRALEASGLRVLTARDKAQPAAPEGQRVHLELVGNDRPGILHEISAALAQRRVSVEELTTEVVSGSMSADRLFRAQASILIPSQLPLEDLQETLEQLAADLMVDIDLAE